MPDTIANNGTAVPDMSRAAAKAIYPNGGRNRTAARVQAALLRGLVGLAAALTAAVLLFLIGYILVNGIPNLKPSLFAWEYNSENVSLMPALINTLLMTAFSLVIATPLGIFAATWLVEYTYSIDTNTNVFPSVHILGVMAAVAAVWNTPRLQKGAWRWGSALYGALIIVSTVFVKQHAVVDVLSGLMVGAIAYVFVYVIVGRRRDKRLGRGDAVLDKEEK